MRHNPAFATEDPEFARALVRAHPWATLVGHRDGAPVASHYPVMLDQEAPELTILTHVGRPDEELLGIGAGGGAELLVIVQGEHGYVSPSWYPPGAAVVPTWNFTAAHLYGVPEVLGEEENLRTLAALVERFERPLQDGARLDPERERAIARRTVGLRIPVSRTQLKRKLSQNKDEETRRRVVAALRRPGPYEHPILAEQMERELGA